MHCRVISESRVGPMGGPNYAVGTHLTQTAEGRRRFVSQRFIVSLQEHACVQVQIFLCFSFLMVMDDDGRQMTNSCFGRQQFVKDLCDSGGGAAPPDACDGGLLLNNWELRSLSYV